MEIQEIRYQKFTRSGNTQKTADTASGQSTSAKGQFTVTARGAYDQVTLSQDAQAALAEVSASAGKNSGNTLVVGRRADAPGTTFAHQLDFEIVMWEEVRQTISDYYTKQNAENQRFADPHRHIIDKYVNYRSPYFRSDMTELERRIARSQEEHLLWGMPLENNSYDYALLPYGGASLYDTIQVKSAELCREQISESIQTLLHENGIDLPEGTEYQLTVDPYDFYIHVQGIQDETLTKAMEAAINVGDNGRLLYDHIESCNPAEFGVPEALGLPAGFDRPNYTQYKGTDPWKMSIYHTVLQLTGLDIRTLDRAGGTFYTPDGQDLWSLLQKLDTEDRYGLMDAYLTCRQLAEYGWNSTSDANRTLAWHNGVWTDPSTLRGQHSEEVWHQDLLNQSHARFETYLAGWEATLQKEAADRAAGRTSTMHFGPLCSWEIQSVRSWRV